jgi:hypothetical protein
MFVLFFGVCFAQIDSHIYFEEGSSRKSINIIGNDPWAGTKGIAATLICALSSGIFKTNNCVS